MLNQLILDDIAKGNPNTFGAKWYECMAPYIEIVVAKDEGTDLHWTLLSILMRRSRWTGLDWPNKVVGDAGARDKWGPDSLLSDLGMSEALYCGVSLVKGNAYALDLNPIGNCVGAANHRTFIGFLISAVLSTIYVSIISAYAGLRTWPPMKYSLGRINGASSGELAWRIINEIAVAFLRSALNLSSRGLILAYLFIASVSLQIGLSVLLWQQLSYIYQGKAYLSHLSSQADNKEEKKDCQNLVRFFGLQYSVTRFLPNFRVTRKRHIK